MLSPRLRATLCASLTPGAPGPWCVVTRDRTPCQQIFQVFTGFRLYMARLYVPPEVIVFFSAYKVRRSGARALARGHVC